MIWKDSYKKQLLECSAQPSALILENSTFLKASLTNILKICKYVEKSWNIQIFSCKVLSNRTDSNYATM